MKAYKRSRGIAPLIVNLGTRWRRVFNMIPPSLYPRVRPPPVWEVLEERKIFCSCGDLNP
jgi:hypothetical protein